MANERILFEPSFIYHVFHHGNAADNIFNTDDNYYYFLKKYQQYGVKHEFIENSFDWPHTSIHAYKSNRPSLLKREDIFNLFNSPSDFWNFHENKEIGYNNCFW
jgi:hypothetical protein